MELASLKSFNSDLTGKASVRENHQRGLRLYADGQYQEAAALLQSALRDEATSERANDCAAAHLACGNREQALADFLLAASLDAENMDAAANLGILLASLGRFREAIPYLQKSAAHADASQRPALTQLLALCANNVAEHTLRESRAAQERAIAANKLPAIPSQPAVAPIVRPPVYMGNNRALLCTTNHCKMYVDTTDLLIAPWLLMHGEWEPEETELVKKLIKPGDVFVDVGANLGYYTLLAIRVGASQVYALEAQESTYELLGKNVIINWMSSVVRYEHLAVFSHTTDLEFFVRNSYPGNSSIGVASPDQLTKWFDTATKVKVHAVSLDDYFADKPTKIDLLKVDVEGAEPAVFEGARRILSENHNIKVLVEWSPDQMATAQQNPEPMVDLWAELGFRAFALHTGLGEVNLQSLLKGSYQNLLLHR
jgi:FkbM family methyltransferase